MKIHKKIVFGLCIVLMFSYGANAHPFYVSICQAEYNRTNSSLEITLKIFADDLMLALENQGASVIFLGEKKENPETNKYIENYLNKTLKFMIDGKSSSYSFIGKETEDDVVWIYLEIEQIKQPNSISINCSLLTEVLETQSNLFQIDVGSGIISALLNKKKQTDILTF